MHNNPFNNPFKAKFKIKKDNNNIIVLKRMELELDDAVVIKDSNKQIISINDLNPNDSLSIQVSSAEPFKISTIDILLPHSGSVPQ